MLSPKVLPTHAASTCHPGALMPVGEVLAVWEDDGGAPVVAADLSGTIASRGTQETGSNAGI
jgi:hypothetical protein